MLAKFVTVGGATIWLMGQTVRAHVANLTINGQRASDTLQAIRATAVQEINRGNQRNQLQFDALLRAGSEMDNLAAFAAAQASLAANGDFYFVEGTATMKLANSQVQLAVARNQNATWHIRVSVSGGAWSSAGINLPVGFAEITGQNLSTPPVAVPGLTADAVVRVSQINIGGAGYTQHGVTCDDGEFVITVPQAPELVEDDGLKFEFSYDVVSLG
jgi:hypothetical protein